MAVGPGSKELLAGTLDHRKKDADRAGVRDAELFATRSETGRKKRQALWAEVDGLLAKRNP